MATIRAADRRARCKFSEAGGQRRGDRHPGQRTKSWPCGVQLAMAFSGASGWLHRRTGVGGGRAAGVRRRRHVRRSLLVRWIGLGAISPQAMPRRGDGRFSDVFAGPSGFVIIGHGDRGSLMWYSPDGRTWTETDLPQLGDIEVSCVDRFESAAVAQFDPSDPQHRARIDVLERDRMARDGDPASSPRRRARDYCRSHAAAGPRRNLGDRSRGRGAGAHFWISSDSGSF